MHNKLFINEFLFAQNLGDPGQTGLPQGFLAFP
jgi:hypothetical protein